jgi:DNA-binding transcriptional ArsR family regulator
VSIHISLRTTRPLFIAGKIPMTPFDDARKAAAMLVGLAEPTRLRIAYQLARGPQHVGKLAELLDIPMVNMSHHLSVMRQAGLIEDTKEGRHVRYSFRAGVLSAGDGDNILAILAIGSLRVVLRVKDQPRNEPKARAKPQPKS